MSLLTQHIYNAYYEVSVRLEGSEVTRTIKCEILNYNGRSVVYKGSKVIKQDNKA